MVSSRNVNIIKTIANWSIQYLPFKLSKPLLNNNNQPLNKFKFNQINNSRNDQYESYQNDIL